MTTRWTRFVALLHDLDAARFPAPMTGAPTAASLLEAARAFVEETVPHEART
jgi:hypothetical protein